MVWVLASSVPVTVTFCSANFVRRLLVAQRVGRLAVIENIGGIVRPDAGDGALGVGRSHAPRGVTGLRAHIVGDDADERLLFRRRRRGSRNGRPGEKYRDESSESISLAMW